MNGGQAEAPCGVLYLCATPIGNLEDITLRVLRVLREVDFIACEDTRHSLKLLNYYEISAKGRLVSYHEHNKASAGAAILKRLQNGESCALVTDAGMPGISDPGSALVSQCAANGVNVTVCPGATAFASALVLSGLPSDNFVFLGFPPKEASKRRALLESRFSERATLIFYEAPHHLKRTLAEIQTVLGDREIAVVRELTKKFEEVIRGGIRELAAHFSDNEPMGEFVIIVKGNQNAPAMPPLSLPEHLELYAELPEREAMKAVARDRGVGKREIYKQLLESKNKRNP